MAITKAKDLRLLSSDDLKQKNKDLKKDLFGLNYQRKLGMVEKPSRFKTIKMDIARIRTVLRERELENGRSNIKA